jgi:hypothetical protein
MNLIVPSDSDEDVIAIFEKDDWRVSVIIEENNPSGPYMNFYTVDDYSDLSVDKSAVIVINSRHLEAAYKGKYGVDDYPSSNEFYAEDQTWPGEKLAMALHERWQTIIWAALGEAMEYAEGWTAEQWLHSQFPGEIE